MWLEAVSKKNWEHDYLFEGKLPDENLVFQPMNKSKRLQHATSTTGLSLIVSESIKALCEEQSIIGLEFLPIKILKQDKLTSQENYFIARPTVIAGKLDYTNTRFLTGSFLNPNHIKKCGISVQWPDETIDVCRPKDTGILLINERFRQLLINIEHAFTGIRINPLNGHEVM